MSICKIHFLPALALGLALSLGYSPLRADETKEGAKVIPATQQGGLLPGETREQKRERLLKGIEEQVGTLAPAQKTHILAILAAAGDEMAAARANTSLTEDQKSNVVRRVHGEVGTRISAALTEAQLAKWNKNNGGYGGTSVSDTAEQRRERLLKRYEKLTDLSIKQKSDLMTVAEASYKEMEDINARTTLTDQQKKEAIKKAHDDSKTKVDAILTKTQREQWQKIQAERKAQRTDRTLAQATAVAQK